MINECDQCGNPDIIKDYAFYNEKKDTTLILCEMCAELIGVNGYEKIDVLIHKSKDVSQLCEGCKKYESACTISNEYINVCNDFEAYCTNDPVNHPSHYTSGKYEVINVIEDWELDYHLGNSIKYIARAGIKNPDKEIEDLQKAVFYINRKINLLKK